MKAEGVHEAIAGFYQDQAIPASSFAGAVLFAMAQPEDVDINAILFDELEHYTTVTRGDVTEHMYTSRAAPHSGLPRPHAVRPGGRRPCGCLRPSAGPRRVGSVLAALDRVAATIGRAGWPLLGA